MASTNAAATHCRGQFGTAGGGLRQKSRRGPQSRGAAAQRQRRAHLKVSAIAADREVMEGIEKGSKPPPPAVRVDFLVRRAAPSREEDFSQHISRTLFRLRNFAGKIRLCLHQQGEPAGVCQLSLQGTSLGSGGFGIVSYLQSQVDRCFLPFFFAGHRERHRRAVVRARGRGARRRGDRHQERGVRGGAVQARPRSLKAPCFQPLNLRVRKLLST